MSWTSRFFAGIIVVGLAWITAIHLYRMYEERLPQEDVNSVGRIFHQVPVQLKDQAPDEAALFLPWSFYGKNRDVYLEDTPLEAEQQREQARQTLRSILADYKDNEKLRAFYADLKQGTGQDLDLVSLSTEQLPVLLQQYPQIQDVMAKHSQDPEFTAVLQEVFNNPQFVRSVMILQANPVK